MFSVPCVCLCVCVHLSVCALEPLDLWTCKLAHTLLSNISQTSSKVIGQSDQGQKCKKSSFQPSIRKYGPRSGSQRSRSTVVGQGQMSQRSRSKVVSQGQSRLGSFVPPSTGGSTRGRFHFAGHFVFWQRKSPLSDILKSWPRYLPCRCTPVNI